MAGKTAGKKSAGKKSKRAMDRVDGAERIRRAAIDLFKRRGFHGTSMRALARAARIEAAGIYYYFPSKQAILFELFDRTMTVLCEGIEAAIASQALPEEQLKAIVRFHVLFHTAASQYEAFISHSELRSLSPRNLGRIIAKRDHYENLLRSVLAAGVEGGQFEIPDIRLTSTAILMMCSGVSDWYVAPGRLSAEDIADYYARMVLRLVRRAGSEGDAERRPLVSSKGQRRTVRRRPGARHVGVQARASERPAVGA